MRKIVALFTALVMLPFALSACGGSSKDTSTTANTTAHSAEVTNQQPVKEDKPVSLNGKWKADRFEAVISDNAIEINIVNGDASALYWKGTFPAGQEIVTSQADRAALDASMVGSQDATKEFNVSGDTIDFKMTAVGVTQTVHLKRA